MESKKSANPTNTRQTVNKSQADERMQEFSKRFSNIHRADEPHPANALHTDDMRKKFLAVRLKNYKPETSNFSLYSILLIIIAFCAGVFVIYQLSGLETQIKSNFCETDDYFSPSEVCDPCPVDAICQNGAIVRCLNEKILRNGQCVPNDQLILLKSRMLEYLAEALAYRKGEAECQGSGRSTANLDEIEGILAPKFKSDKHYTDAFKSLYRELSEVTGKIGGLEIADDFDSETGFVRVLQAPAAKYSFSCKLWIIHRIYFFEIWGSVLCMLGLVYLILKKRSERKYVLIAENLYRAALLKIKQNGMLAVRNLLDELDVKLTKPEREFVLSKLNHIRKVDEQITHVVEKGEKYWVLL